MPRLRSSMTLFALVFVLVLSGCNNSLKGRIMGWWAYTPGDDVDDAKNNGVDYPYKPTQPIPFNHQLHAGKREIACEYCHTAARHSASAGIIPLSGCMTCHNYVNTDAEAVQFMAHKYKNNESIEWIKVHALPHYAKFNHSYHVNAKDEDGSPRLVCQSCHGSVQNMEVVEMVAPLQMGWCISCHMAMKADIKDHFVDPKDNDIAMALHPNPSDPESMNAPVSCNTCHY